jgi:hypothetical protein
MGEEEKKRVHKHPVCQTGNWTRIAHTELIRVDTKDDFFYFPKYEINTKLSFAIFVCKISAKFREII